MREKGKWLGKLIQFEILYRVCLYLFVNPLLSQLLRLYLNRARSGMTFNSDIVMRFLSLPGIFLALFYMLVGTGLIVFEFSVILHLIDKGQRGEPRSLPSGVILVKRHPQSSAAVLYAVFRAVSPGGASGVYQRADSTAAGTGICDRRASADSVGQTADQHFLAGAVRSGDLSLVCADSDDFPPNEAESGDKAESSIMETAER